jgi:MYXO-CTERM domain-containing protein
LVIVAAGLLPQVAAPARADYIYDPLDFATSVEGYVEGTGVGSDWLSGQKFNDPNSALGRPTVDTTGDGWFIPMTNPVPVVNVYPAFRAYELVTIGNGGSLTVRFDRQIENDPDNPYGIDLIVFGNAFQVIGGGQGWTNGDPNLTTVGSTGFTEPGIVEVSQNGVDWQRFETGPYADDFCATLGRVYDPDNPAPSIGVWNQWWGAPSNPTVPMDPSLGWSSFGGMTQAEMAEAHVLADNGEASAGGTGFDLDWLATPLDWVQYIRVVDNPDSGATTEIDAFADVAPLTSDDVPVAEPGLGGLLAVAAGVALRRRKRA